MSDVNGFMVLGVIVAVAFCYFIVTFVFAFIICTLADATDVGMVFAVAYIIASTAFIIVMTQYVLGTPCPIKI